jgi:class 3 adenylate cyclase
VRIGIHSGEVVVGKIGDDLRMDYTAQGVVVGLAARLQALAEAGKTTSRARRPGASRATSASRTSAPWT